MFPINITSSPFDHRTQCHEKTNLTETNSLHSSHFVENLQLLECEPRLH
jgi:hypothetical protein